MNTLCYRCHKTGVPVKWCGICRGVKYCSQECQKADWSVHKNLCKSEYFEYNKTIIDQVRKIYEDHRVMGFISGFARYQIIHGNKKYLRVIVLNINNEEKILCTGTNEIFPVTNEDIIEGNDNIILTYKTERVSLDMVLGLDSKQTLIDYEITYRLLGMSKTVKKVTINVKHLCVSTDDHTIIAL